MSCGNGCGCCPKCGCRATCTCNQSLWFDDMMNDLSYNVITAIVTESGNSGARCACSTGSATQGYSTGFFSEAAAFSAYYG